MSEKFSFIPQLNVNAATSFDANTIQFKSDTPSSSAKNEKFSSYLDNHNGSQADKGKDNKPSQQSIHTHKSPHHDKVNTFQQSSSENNKQDQSDLSTVKDEMKKILRDEDLSIAEKITELQNLDAFTALSSEQQINMLASFFEDMPALKDSFAAFFEEQNLLLNNAALDDTTEEESDNIIAILQDIIIPNNNPASQAELSEGNVALDTLKSNNGLPLGGEQSLRGENKENNPETTAEDLALDENVIQENTAKTTEQAQTVALSKEALTTPSSQTSPDNSNTLLSSLGTFSQPQVTQQNNNVNRANMEFKIATIPLKDNVSLVITKAPEAPNKIGINLEPAGMGDAELVIETQDNVVTAVIRSDKADVLDMIRKETASLERHLKDAGIDLGGGNLQFEQKQSNDNASDNTQRTTISAQIETDNLSYGDAQSSSENIYQTLSNINLSQGVDVRL